MHILYTEKNEIRFLHPSCGNPNVIPVLCVSQAVLYRLQSRLVCPIPQKLKHKSFSSKVVEYTSRVATIHSELLCGVQWGKAKLYTHMQFQNYTSEFHRFPNIGLKQLCALAHLGCTREVGTS